MNRIFQIILWSIFIVPYCWSYDHTFNLPQPQFVEENFLRMPGIPEMNIDFALAWTDSAAGLFLKPFDAVILHVSIEGDWHDIYIISDMAMQRLCIWMCSAPDTNGERFPEVITAYYGEDCGYLKAPSGMTTNAKNRAFDPENDLIYLADRGNDRILELSYTPNKDGGQISYNRTIGNNCLEWPVDVALASYGTGQPAYTDIWVVDSGHKPQEGELYRFNLNGDVRGHWYEIPTPENEERIFPLSDGVSIESYPDTLIGVGNLFISNASNNLLFQYLVSYDTDPVRRSIVGLQFTSHFWQSGGVACDDYGRIYVCNYAASLIEMWEPYLGWPYLSYGDVGPRQEPIHHPNNIVFDTYYGVCEALVFENYTRTTGLKTYIIEGGSSQSKSIGGFTGGNLVRSASKPAAAPIAYSLENAFPNPFNSECLISYSLPEKSRVTIDVYNILGQKVANLVNDEKPQGNYSVGFNARSLSSGTYFFKMNAGDFTASKMVVLVK